MSEETYDVAQEDPTPITVEYQCTHLTCRLQCYTGKLTLTKGRFDRLAAGAAQLNDTGAQLFRSPSMVCKIASTQDFRVVAMTAEDAELQQEIEDNVAALTKRRSQLRRALRHEKEEYKRKAEQLRNEIHNLTSKIDAQTGEEA